MAAKPRKSVVQNIIKNLLEMEIPEIQTASKELAEWIKQLEQHSFKLQHYATEIENWASEEEEVDSIELTDLIKDLEATLTDMRKAGTLSLAAGEKEEDDDNDEAPELSSDRLMRSYGRAGRVLPEPKVLPRAELKRPETKVTAKTVAEPVKTIEEVRKEPARTPQGVLVARDTEKTKVKAELPMAGKEVVSRETAKKIQPKAEGDSQAGYMTPEGFLIRRLRP